MTSGTNPRPRQRRMPAGSFTGIAAGAILAFAAFMTFFIIFLIGYRSLYSGRIFPGVYVNGISLGGLDLDSAEKKLIQFYTFPTTGQLILKADESSWLLSPAQMGIMLDSKGSSLDAFQQGRIGSWIDQLRIPFSLRKKPINLSVKLIFDQRTLFTQLSHISRQVNIPVHEPELSIQGNQVNILPGSPGQTLDIPASIQAISDQAATGNNGVIALIIQTDQPVSGSMEDQAELARTILSAPFTIQTPPNLQHQKGPWIITQDELAQMLTFERVPVNNQLQYQVSLKTHLLRDLLRKIKPSLDTDPLNPRFIFNDDTHQLELQQEAVIGCSMNLEESLKIIQNRITEGQHTAELALNITTPPIANEVTGEQLGITQLVHSETSYFYGSSPDRVQNITIAAAQFHGLLVAPGETFSMASAIGDISLDNGYAEAIIIYGNQSIKGVGGGVCQVSTTLFRAAFFTGFPIPVRHAHAYRVSYYEMISGGRINTDLAGMDATVYAPVVDLKFVNDTPWWLLMETYVNPSSSSITWKFYSTSDGRNVEWHTSGLQNVTSPPEPAYTENPELSAGTVKQVDWAVDGADVSVSRTVRKNGELYFQDHFDTHFQAWQAKFQYGPGTPDMPPSKE